MFANRDEAHAGWGEFARQHVTLLVSAPPPQRLRALRCSPLVDAEPLPDHEQATDGA